MLKKIVIFILILASNVSYAQHESVVRVINKHSFATAFFYKDKYLVTNAHVCLDNYMEVVRGKSQPIFTVVKIMDLNHLGLQILKTSIDLYHDLCVMSLNKKVVSFKTFNELQPRPNQSLMILSLDQFGDLLGRFKGPDPTVDEFSFYHQDSHIINTTGKQGMSGSPIVNTQEEVIGVLWGVSFDKPEIYYTPVKYLEKLLKQL